MYRKPQPVLFCLSILLLVMACNSVSLVAQDETPGEQTTPTQQVDPKLAKQLASPRSTVESFILSMIEGKTDDAENCMDLSDIERATRASIGPVYAFKLKSILDMLCEIDFSLVQDDPEFDGEFVLSEHMEQLVFLTLDNGKIRDDQYRGEAFEDAEDIIVSRGEDGLWRFSKETIDLLDDLWTKWSGRQQVAEAGIDPLSVPLAVRIEQLFDGDGWQKRFFLLKNYQWLCLLVVVLIGFVADFLVRLILKGATSAWLRYAKVDVSEKSRKGMWRPVGFLIQGIVWYIGSTIVGLPENWLTILLALLMFYIVIAAVWTSFRLIDLLVAWMQKKAKRTPTRYDDVLVPMISRMLKAVAACVGVVFFADMFNLDWWGLVGGLGIGGIALAFAAQDAISNFFGSVTVMTDRPFEVGDWIVAEGVEGTVEKVGFRSTRIRTFYNSQIVLPNSRLTTAIVDNMGRRKYRRVKTMLAVQYDTSPEQIEAFCEGIRELLKRHPYTRKDYYHVYLNDLSDSSLNILLYCFIECPDWSVELREKHRLYLDIIRLAKELKISFAFPTRTLHMFNEEHGDGSLPFDPSQPELAGQRFAAQVAGPPKTIADRPGLVEFGGPTDLDE